MRISGYDYTAGHVGMTRDIPDFSTGTGAAQPRVQEAEHAALPSGTNPFAEDGQRTALKLSGDGPLAAVAFRAGEQTASGGYAPINFSTAPDTAGTSEEAGSGSGSMDNAAAESRPAETEQNGAAQPGRGRGTDSQILNQYRYFVRSAGYEGSEGSVRRIFG